MRHHHIRARHLLAATSIVATLALVACGDDDESTDTTDAPASSPVADSAPTEPASTEPASTEPDAEPATGETIEVTATDYAFIDLPATVKPGTKLSLVNSSTVELHEMVVIKIPDSETRTVEELVALPEEEAESVFGAGPPALVQLAMPNMGEQIPALGDGTLTEPGRYAVVCFIPQGADPAEFMAQAENSEGPPAVEGGPPHAVLGMYAEVTVEG